MRAIIVGGGIGGLTAAIALRQAGWSVQVIERAEQFGEVGAGVQLGPNATRVLKRLGLGEKLDEIAVAPEAVRFLRWADDAVLTEWQIAELLGRFGAPYYTLYRPDLIEILAAAQPSESMMLGTEVTDVSATRGGAAVSTADGTRLEADLVLGCDGIHSTVRSHAIGDVPARFSGMCAYRAMVPSDGVEQMVRNWLGPHRHLVAYPVGRGGRYVNLVCVDTASNWRTESWTAPGDPDDLRNAFKGWSHEVTGLLDRVAGPIYRWGLYDREPLPTWLASAIALRDLGHLLSLRRWLDGCQPRIGRAG